MSGELDEFRLVRPLGRGGMGEVFLGHDTILDRAVAIKLIGSRTPDAASRERFLIEARAIARLSHPNVVTIYRVGTTADGRPFLAQELIRGQSLDRVARPMPWRRVCELAIGISRGLEAAHRRGILHRDVKPANVMLDEHGTARLLDFGLAKLTGGEGASDGEGEGGGGGEGAAGGVAATAGVPRAADDATPDERRRTRGANAAETRGRSEAAEEGDAAVAETRDAPEAAEEGDAAVAETRDAPEAVGQGDAAVAATQDVPGVGAGAAAAEAAAAPRTATGTILGTPRYTAPELWRGAPASVRSELYSLGVLLYELLAGTAPHPYVDIGELQRSVLSGPVRPISELAPEAHPALAALVMRCLASEPRERPGSAAAIAHELEAVLVGAPAVPEGNPYRGLRAFDAAHRGLFFGRGADVDAIVDRLRTEPLIAVAGDSGIGKSSVCHAGVVPAVLAGSLGDHRTWRAVSLVPGRTPWAALCEALAISAERPEELVRALRPAGAGAGILLVIDQLEELVTLSAPGEAAQVAEVLAAIADGAAPGAKALLAVRGDFLTRVAALPELGGPLSRGLHLLRALSAPDLREAIAGPARATGVRYETDAMIEELALAVADNPGALPLLQFTLAELWQARDAARGAIPAAALERLGGALGGLAGHADAVLLGLGAEARAAARRIVLRLVTPARTRAVRERGELAGAGDDTAAAALESLVRGRLVVARDTAAGAPSYELAHEALIRSWGTLRDWLDEEAGQHAARNRLQASAAEWQRLGRRADLLWTRRQLDEVRALGELTAAERAFVAASRRAQRRRRLARIAAIAAVPLVALAIFAGVRFEAARTRARAVEARLGAATAHHAAADRLAVEAAAARTDALRRFDAREDGEPRWAEARRLAAEAHVRYGDAIAELEAAFLLDGAAARERMAAVLWSRAELAEAEHDRARVDELLRRLATYAPARAAAWQRPGRLVLELDRPARVSLHALLPGFGAGPPAAPAADRLAGGFSARPLLERTAARLDEALPPGSYLAVIALPDGLVVREPFLLARGERLVRTHALPARADAPPGFVYVPEGRFLFGSNHPDPIRRQIFDTSPLHPVDGQAFWISRTETTYEDWLAFLRALPPEERKVRAPSGDVALEELEGRFTLAITPSPRQVHRAAEGERLVYPGRSTRREVQWARLPISGVSYDDAVAYASWLAASGRVPRARLCSVEEWERAARGADGRTYPHGEELAPGDANFDATYGPEPSAFGPDEVGSFAVSDSPYGISDLAGNVWEFTADAKAKQPQQRLRYKGGSFYQNRLSAVSSNGNSPGERSQRNVRIGLRICADAARAR